MYHIYIYIYIHIHIQCRLVESIDRADLLGNLGNGMEVYIYNDNNDKVVAINILMYFIAH